MIVTLHYSYQAREAAGTRQERIELDAPCTTTQLLLVLARRHEGLRPLLLDDAGKPHPTALLFINDAQVTNHTPRELRGGEDIFLLSPVAGG